MKEAGESKLQRVEVILTSSVMKLRKKNNLLDNGFRMTSKYHSFFTQSIVFPKVFLWEGNPEMSIRQVYDKRSFGWTKKQVQVYSVM